MGISPHLVGLRARALGVLGAPGRVVVASTPALMERVPARDVRADEVVLEPGMRIEMDALVDGLGAGGDALLAEAVEGRSGSEVARVSAEIHIRCSFSIRFGAERWRSKVGGAAAVALLVNGGAEDVANGAKDAAVAGLWLRRFLAGRAGPSHHAGIDGHRRRLVLAAGGTGQR